jgi:hypothetical protein
MEAQYNATVQVLRLTEGADDKKEYTEIYATIPCHIQPVSGETTGDVPGAYGKDFRMFCGVLGIKEGDRVIYDGNEYRVTSAQTLDFMGEAHQELTIRAFRE